MWQTFIEGVDRFSPASFASRPESAFYGALGAVLPTYRIPLENRDSASERVDFGADTVAGIEVRTDLRAMQSQQPGGYPYTIPWSSSGATPQAAPWGAAPAPQTTRVVLKVFGIIGAALAGVNLLGNGLSIVQVLFQRSMMQNQQASSPEMAEAMGRMTEMITASTKLAIGHGAAMIVMDVAMIVIGVMLFQRSELGRKLAIAWAVTAFAVLVGRAISFELVMMPVLDRYMASFREGLGTSTGYSDGMFSTFARAGTYVSLVFLAIFPTSLLVAMNLASVKQSVRQPLEPAGAERG